MPQKIMMNLNSNSSSSTQYVAYLSALQQATVAHPPKSSSLKTPMIGRIHSVRPGCGSCGRG